MEINDAIGIVSPAPESQYRLVPCDCGNDQPVYIARCDGKWQVKCLDCRKKTDAFQAQHDAQVHWNKGDRHEES